MGRPPRARTPPWAAALRAALVAAAACGGVPLARAHPVPSSAATPASPSLQDFDMVLVSVDALPVERFAAEQLAHWLSQARAVNVSVVNVTSANATRADRPHIVVGAGAAAAILPPGRAEQLAGRKEAFACWSTNWKTHHNGNSCALTGTAPPPAVALTGGVGQPRGTLIAVFEFLRDVGFRFWNPAHPNRTAVVTVPEANAAVPPCDRVYEPPFEYRLFNGHVVGAGDPLWRVQNHMYGAMDAEIPTLPAEEGGGVGYVNRYFVSDLYTLVPPEQHFQAHPEWYSYGCIHGNCTRRHEWKPGGPPAAAKAGRGVGCDMAQLCLSNPTLRSFAVSQTLAVLASLDNTTSRGARPSIISVSQNDCSAGSRCQCAQCLAMEKALGGMAGPFLALANAAATAVAKRFPDMAVDTLAYTFTADAPNSTAPTPVTIGNNTIVRWAPIAIDQAYPLANQRHPGMYSTQLAAAQLSAWAAKAKSGGGKLYSWLYYFNERNWLMPQPNWFNIVPDIELLARSGARGIFAEGVGSYPVVEMDELRAWLLASLAFDPSRNGTALVHEFLNGYYGSDAAPLVLEHMRVWQQAVLDSTPTGNCTDVIDAHVCPRKLTKVDNATALWVTPTAILRSAAALKRALTVAPPQYRPQIDRLWVSTRFVLLFNWNATCAAAQKLGLAWPVQQVLGSALSDLEASLAAAQVELIDSQRHNASWLKNGSGLDLTLRCGRGGKYFP